MRVRIDTLFTHKHTRKQAGTGIGTGTGIVTAQAHTQLHACMCTCLSTWDIDVWKYIIALDALQALPSAHQFVLVRAHCYMRTPTCSYACTR